MGTVLGHMSSSAEAFGALLGAIHSLDARVLVTVGRHLDPAELGPVPSNVHVEPWVDQADVLASASLVVCHGGSGTVLGALAAGAPLVMVPSFADQFENSRRVALAGAGRVVANVACETRRPPRATDAPRIASAIDDVLADPSFTTCARVIGVEMDAQPIAADVLTTLQAHSNSSERYRSVQHRTR